MSEEAGSVLAGNPATEAAPASSPAQWYGEVDSDTATWIQAKGIPDLPTALNSYRNLEKLLGADKAGRAIVPPKDDSPPEEWDSFFNKLGRPESADKYQLPLPDGDGGEFAQQAATWFHEAGLTQKQAELIAAKWNEYTGTALGQEQSQFEQQSTIDLKNLQKEWGEEFDANAELARRAIREAGLTQDEGREIEKALGVAKAAKVFAFLGKQFAEAPGRGFEGAKGSFTLTPETARARIEMLKKDSAWSAKYLSGDSDARAEFDRLHQIAFA